MLNSKKPDTDWESLPERAARPKRGIFMNIDGPEGSGKSSLALSLARVGPLAYIDIDQSVDRAKRPDDKKSKAGVKVHHVRYVAGGSEEAVKAECGKAFVDSEKKIKEAAAGWASGVVIDTATENWEIIRLASFGTLNPKGNRMDRLYGPVNARFRNLHRAVYRTSGKHLITIHQVKDEYVDKMKDGQLQSVRTGKQVRAGFKEIGYLCDLSLRLFREGNEFKALVELCKLNPIWEGMEIDGDDLDFARIMAKVTDTEEEDWLP